MVPKLEIRQNPFPKFPNNGTMPRPMPPGNVNTLILLIPVFVVIISVILLLLVVAIHKLCVGRGIKRGQSVYPAQKSWWLSTADVFPPSTTEKIELPEDLTEEPSSLNAGNATILITAPSPPPLEPELSYDDVALLPEESALDTHAKNRLRPFKKRFLDSRKKRKLRKTVLDRWRDTFTDQEYQEVKLAIYDAQNVPIQDQRLLESQSTTVVVPRPMVNPENLTYSDSLRRINTRPTTSTTTITPTIGFVVNQDLLGSQPPSNPVRTMFSPTQSIDPTPQLVDLNDPLDELMGWGGVSVHDGGSITFRKTNERSVTSNVSLRPLQGNVAYFESLYSLLGTDHAWVMAFRSAQATAAAQQAAQHIQMMNQAINGAAAAFWLRNQQNQSTQQSNQSTQQNNQSNQPTQSNSRENSTSRQPSPPPNREDPVAEERVGIMSAYDQDTPEEVPVTTPTSPVVSTPQEQDTWLRNFNRNAGVSIPFPNIPSQRLNDPLIPAPPSMQLLLQQPPGMDELVEVEEHVSGQPRRTTLYVPSRATLSSLLPTPGDTSVQVATGLVTRPYPPFLLPGRMPSSVAYVSGGYGAYISASWMDTNSRRLYKRVIDLGRDTAQWFTRQGDTVGVGHVPALGGVFFTVNGKRVPVNDIQALQVAQVSQSRLMQREKHGDEWLSASDVVKAAHAMISRHQNTEEVVELLDWVPYLVCVGAHWNWYPNVGATGPCQILVNMGKDPSVSPSVSGGCVGGRKGFLWEGSSEGPLIPTEPPPPFEHVTPISAPAQLETDDNYKRSRSIGHRARASLDAALAKLLPRTSSRGDDVVLATSSPSFVRTDSNISTNSSLPDTIQGRFADPMSVIDAALDNQPILSETARNILRRSSEALGIPEPPPRASLENRRMMATMFQETPPEYRQVISGSSPRPEARPPGGSTIGLDSL